MTPKGGGGILTIFSQCVEVDVDGRETRLIIVEISRDALDRIEAGLFRRHAAFHAFDDAVRAGDSYIFFAAPRRSSAADVLIHVQAGTDDRGIANASGDLPGEAAGCRDSRHFAF